MLAEEKIQLLTGYVDGELSQRQRQAVLRLLHQSSEARDLLLQLQQNAYKIKQLPRRTLDAGFADQVVRVIVNTKVAVLPRRPVVVGLRWLPYVLTAAAAAVLFATALGGGLYLALGGAGTELANGLIKPDVDEPPVPPAVESPKDAPAKPDEPSTPRKTPNPMIHQMIAGVYSEYAAHIPPPRSYTFSLKDLDKDAVAVQVESELKKSDAFQLDVAVRNNPEAIARLNAVLKKHDIKLVVDPTSNAAGKKELLVYAENVTAKELAKILKQLAHEEKKAANPFGKMTVAALAKGEEQQVVALLGVDPTKRVDPSATVGMKDKKGKPLPGKAERVVVVLPQAPQKSTSMEVSQFLNQTAQPQPGSIRVLLRIRQE